MRKAIAVFAALLALTLLPARAEADYANTVLIYMIGADLQESGYAAEDLEEMLGADIGADTCVLLLAGPGSPMVWDTELWPENVLWPFHPSLTAP